MRLSIFVTGSDLGLGVLDLFHLALWLVWKTRAIPWTNQTQNIDQSWRSLLHFPAFEAGSR